MTPALNLAALWPIAVFIGVVWTLVVLVYDAARNDRPARELWAVGGILIGLSLLLSLMASGAVQPF